MVNWFKYRLPNSAEIFSGASETINDGFGNGFVVAPFREPSMGIKTIPFDFIPEESVFYPINSKIADSTPKEDYLHEVKTIIETLGDKRGKVVASRAIRIETKIDLNETFKELCISYPDAFVFMFSTTKTGTWIGASPELLMKKSGDSYMTMALAGTRIADSGTDWDKKNIEEQEMVGSFIMSCMSRHFVVVSCTCPMTRRAGNIEHLCTEIRGRSWVLKPGQTEELFVMDLLCELSPTPALCGSDRDLSFGLIKNLEKFDREMYGGFCGPNNINDTTAFYVNLRSAKCTPDAICVFAGGGITPLSHPEAEWQETEIKSKTIITKLKNK